MIKKCPRGCNAGHLLVKGVWQRCDCLSQTIYRRDLGVFATDSPKRDSPLAELTQKSILIEGVLTQIRPHVAGVILSLKDEGKSFTAMDAYRLVEIFLDKDEEFKTTSDIAQYDLFVMLLGFGDIKNQRLPDIIVQALQRRELLQKPTWVILGVPLGQVPVKYNQEVHDLIKNFQRVVAK